MNSELSVIMPAYNEEAGIEIAVRELAALIPPLVPNTEIIVVDDGSRDRTGEILDRLAPELNLTVLHQKNGGHGAALMAGMMRAQGSWLFLVDADRQITMEDFTHLWARREAFDLGIGVRAPRRDPLLRIILTRIIRAYIHWVFRVRLRDANSPFKLVRQSVWERSRDYIPPETLAPSLFLSIAAARMGYRILEISATHRPRETGAGSLRVLKLTRFCIRSFAQLIRFHRTLP